MGQYLKDLRLNGKWIHNFWQLLYDEIDRTSNDLAFRSLYRSIQDLLIFSHEGWGWFLVYTCLTKKTREMDTTWSKRHRSYMRYRYFVHFRHGISVFVNFSYGIGYPPMSPSPWKTPWEFPQRVTCVAHGHFMYHSFNVNTLSFYRKHLLYGTDPYYVDKIPWGDYWYYTSLAVPSWECERLPPTNFNIFTVNVIWWTYLISFTVQCCFLFRFVCTELVSLSWVLQIWVAIYVCGTIIN